MEFYFTFSRSLFLAVSKKIRDRNERKHVSRSTLSSAGLLSEGRFALSWHDSKVGGHVPLFQISPLISVAV